MFPKSLVLGACLAALVGCSQGAPYLPEAIATPSPSPTHPATYTVAFKVEGTVPKGPFFGQPDDVIGWMQASGSMATSTWAALPWSRVGTYPSGMDLTLNVLPSEGPISSGALVTSTIMVEGQTVATSIVNMGATDVASMTSLGYHLP